MKQRTCTGALVLLLLCLAAGCGEGERTGTDYDVYFLSEQVGQEQALVPEQHTLPTETDPVEGLLALLLAGPTGESLTGTIPNGVTLRGWELSNGLLTVDFSGRYCGLSGISLTLADYSVVLTLSQLPQVEAVMITAEGELLSYRDHQRLTAADAWTAVGQDQQEKDASQTETS